MSHAEWQALPHARGNLAATPVNVVADGRHAPRPMQKELLIDRDLLSEPAQLEVVLTGADATPSQVEATNVLIRTESTRPVPSRPSRERSHNSPAITPTTKVSELTKVRP